MGKQGQSIQSTFSPKQIEIIKTGIALKYSDSQGASEIINFKKIRHHHQIILLL